MFTRKAGVAILVLAFIGSPGFAQDRFFHSNGVPIRYVEQGSGDAIVLLHGGGASLDGWVNSGMLQDLANDYRVIAFDIRGHGKSGKPHEASAYGPEMGLDVIRLLDHLGIRRAHIVGYSLGAFISAQLLTTHPERFLSATLGGAPGRFRWSDAQAALAEQEASERARECVSRSQILRLAAVNEPKPDEAEIKRRSAACMADPTQDRFAQAALVRSQGAGVITPAQAAAVKVPTLGVVGSLDSYHAEFQELKQLRPDLKLVVIEGATHNGERGALRRAEFIAAVREFIGSHRTAPSGTGARTSQFRPSAPYAADACRTGLARGDTARFVGVNRTYGLRRPLDGEMRIWADSANHIRFSESFAGSPRSVWNGEIDLAADATLQRIVWRSYVNDTLRNSRSVERVGDSVVSVNDGTRTAQRLPTGVLRFPERMPRAAFAVIAQCALARGEGGLRTAEYGVVRVAKGVTTRVRAAGTTKTVSLYAVSADSAPYLAHLWLDDLGRLFAHNLADIGFAIPPEWAPAIEQLLVAETDAAAPRMRETAADLAVKPAAGIVFIHARVMDVERGTVAENMSVVVRGSRIVTVGPDASIKPSGGALVVDATGKTLMPGLWNFNANAGTDLWAGIYDDGARSVLSRGVTSVYEIHGDTLYAPRLIRRVESGGQAGPRLLTTCAMSGWVPDVIDGAVSRFRDAENQVKDREELRRLVARCAAQGRQWMNLFSTFPPELVRPAIAEAHSRGVRIMGGGLRNWSTQDMLDAGVDGFAHVGQSLFAMVPSDTSRAAWDVGRTGNAALFWTPGRALADLDLGSPAARRVIEQIVKRRLPMGTSLCVYPPINRTMRQHDTTYDAAIFRKLTEYVGVLHRAGAMFVPGTEGRCPMSRELQLLAETGFTNAELLSLVTIGAARFAGLDREVGTVAAGKRADLILIDGDPLARLADLDRVTMVMRDGSLYRDLAAMRGVRTFLPRTMRR
jgi:pimeloyl-ACP methyl ester carboxylesterase